MHHRIALKNGASAQQQVHGIGGFMARNACFVRLPRRRLAGERTLVDGEGETLDYGTVGWHFLAGFQNHDVAYHDIATSHLRDMTRAQDLDHSAVVALVEQTELLVGIDFYQKAHQRGQHDSQKDAQGLKEYRGAHVQPKILINRQTHRKRQCHKQNLDERVIKLLYELPPQRLTSRRGDYIGTILLPAGNHLLGRQAF